MANQVELWVKAEPFSYGALPVAPHPRINLTNIKKIVIYAKNKGSAGFPKLSYSVWKHIACNKLHLTEDLAWVYFETCHFLTTDLSPAERTVKDEHFAACSSPEDRGQLRGSFSVDTLKFVLFLYIQQLYKVSLRASLVAGDEWPTQSSTSDLDSRSTPRGSKSLDDHSHQVFVQSNLAEMVELLSESEGSGGNSGQGSLTSLPLASVEALGFLMAGSADKSAERRVIMPLQDIAVLQTVVYRSGYSKASRTFSARHFQLWVRDCLSQNPFSVSACIALGTRLTWPFAAQDADRRDPPDGATGGGKRGKIATNAHVVPKEHVTGNKLIIMTQVSKQTIARSSGTLERSTVKIHRSHYSFIYLLSPLRSVTVEKCRHTTVVLGPVEAFVHVSNCDNVTLIAPCRTLMVSGSTLCSLQVLTPQRPLLLSGNDTVTLAPLSTHFPPLDTQLTTAGISPTLNLWDRPLCIGPDHRDDLPVWSLLPPADFYMFTVPFDMEGPTKSVPGGLPGRYQRAVTQRQRQIDGWQATVKEAGLTRDQRKEFQSLVEARFHVWLAETGHKRELDSLAVPLQHHD